MDSLMIGVFTGGGMLLALLSVKLMTEGDNANEGIAALIASALIGLAACMAYSGITGAS